MTSANSDKHPTSQHCDRFQLVTKLALRTANLRRSLVEYHPHIIHFSGHSTETHGVVLENDQAKVQIVSITPTEPLTKVTTLGAKVWVELP